MKLIVLVVGLALFQLLTQPLSWSAVVAYFFGLAIGWTFCHDIQKEL